MKGNIEMKIRELIKMMILTVSLVCSMTGVIAAQQRTAPTPNALRSDIIEIDVSAGLTATGKPIGSGVTGATVGHITDRLCNEDNWLSNSVCEAQLVKNIRIFPG